MNRDKDQTREDSPNSKRISLTTFRDLIVIAFLLMSIWKLFTSDFSITIERLETNDLLSIILALFAIGLSAFFYVQANKISNMFYDNMFKFTKNNSEILGRMEAGFGEQLRNIHEDNSKIRDKVYDIYHQESKIETEEQNIEDGAKEVEEIKKEHNEIIEGLAKKAKIDEEEKQEIFKALNNSEKKLRIAENELRLSKHKLREIQQNSEQSYEQIKKRVETYTRINILASILEKLDIYDSSYKDMRLAWRETAEDLPEGYLKDMKIIGAISEDNNLTRKGVSMLRRLENH